MLPVVPFEAPVAPRRAPAPPPPVPTPGEPSRARAWRRIAGAIALSLVLALSAALVLWAKAYRVTSGSMEPTTLVGQRILADHLGASSWRPKVGNVIVFNAPAGAAPFADQECATKRAPGTACLTALPGVTPISFIKRVVGLPGDTLQVVHGHVLRDGVPEREPFAKSCDDEICNLAPFVVPADHYFVMGDNRGDSDDSRFWGPLTRSQITGHVFASYWPLSRLGGI